MVRLDLVPFMDKDELCAKLNNRIKAGFAADELTAGILPNKFSAAFKGSFTVREPAFIAALLKKKEFAVSSTRGWNEADFTAGGIDVSDVDEVTMESRLKRKLFFAGEILDVNGDRGGYNLAWAWASGFIAGLSQYNGQI